MKTVPTVRLVDTTDAAALPDLPDEIALAMTDIAGAAREGLMAMSVAAGMAVMAAMFEAEIAAACGPKGKHDPSRAAVRHGQGRGSVTSGGRRVAVTRPRARTVDGHEVPLDSYAFRRRGPAHPGGDGADAGRGGHPPACPHRRADR
jgi:putative transposase